MISNQRGSTAQEAPGYGVTWGGVPMFARRAMTVGLATLVAAGVAGPASAATTASAAEDVSVIVRELAGAGNAARAGRRRVRRDRRPSARHPGRLHRQVPSDRLAALRAVAGVESVTEDAGLTLASTEISDQAAQNGSLYTIANKVTGASSMWDAGYTGKGVDVAVIDSGIVPVDGFKTPGKVVYGPDLTLEASTGAKNLDTYGHGTHMSSIIAGRDSATTGTGSGDSANFVGMAPMPGSSASRWPTARARPTCRRPSRPSTGSSRTGTRTA